MQDSKNQTSAYSATKALWHIDRVSQLREGKQIVPTHVQLILSDLCSHNCFPAGTMIETPFGEVPIENLRIGDIVTGPDGEPVSISQTGSRQSGELFEVTVGDKTVYATGEHPFLTQDGWKEARHLVAQRDFAIVRIRNKTSQAICKRSARRRDSSRLSLRMRRETEMESSMEAVGKVHLWPSSFQNENSIFDSPFTDAANSDQRRACAALSLRLRKAGSQILKKTGLDELSFWPSKHWEERQDVRRLSQDHERSHEGEQSNAKKGCCCQGIGNNEREANKSLFSGRSQYCRCGSQANAIRPKPDAESRCSSGGNCQAIGEKDIKERTAFQGVGRDERNRIGTYGRWQHLDWSQQPGLSYSRTKESYRGNAKGMFCGGAKAAIAEELCVSEDKKVSRQGMAMPGDFQERPSIANTERTDQCDSRLRIAGIELERGLALQPISSVRRISRSVVVYNFACPPIESYIAGGIVVHNCGFCSYRWDGNISNQLFHIVDPSTGKKNHNPNRMLPFEKVLEILDDCAEMGVRAIQFTGGGEPTVYPRHHEVFEYALSKGLEISLVSHGVLLKPAVIDTLTRATWVRISVDAGNPQTYASVRRIGEEQYHRALKNIGLLCEARDRTNSKLVVGVGFVVTKDNWREVVDAARTAKELGANSFRISAVFQPDGDTYFSGFYEDAAELCRSAAELSDSRFLVTNSFGNRVSDLRQGAPDYDRCGYMQFTTYLAGDGNAYRCCNTSYNKQGLIGSFLTQRFKELWFSQAKQDDFEQFNARSCERCQFNLQNRAIATALEEPMHANFV